MLAKHGRRFFGLAGLIAVAALALALPAPAGASTASVDAGTLTVSGATGEINRISIEKIGSFFRVFDDTALLTTSDPDCHQVSDHFARCSKTGVTSVRVLAGDQDDIVTLNAPTPGILKGGPGFDTLTGGTGDDELFAGRTGSGFGSDLLSGDKGADTVQGPPNASNSIATLAGGNGPDKLLGGPGQEHLEGGLGADNIRGGDGSDTVSYLYSPVGVTVTLDDNANDAEGDNVHSDVENITGSFSADDLTGSALNNSIQAQNGNDVIQANDGNDFLDGGADGDTIRGGAGDDFILGGFDNTAADVFIGGAGNDRAVYGDHFDAATPLSITIDNVADDGAPGEGDNVHTDVEDVQGGSGDDTIIGNGQANELIGADGDDTLKGGRGDDELLGDFEFGGGTGADKLDGGDNDDLLTGGGGPDKLIGNAGFDTANYSNANDPLTVTVDDVADDGASGENDNVRTTVETVLGGANADSITGSPGPDVLMGGGDADILDGAGGDDLLDGEILGFFSPQAGDTFKGGAGNDTVSYASHSNNVIADNDGVADDGAGGTEGDNVRPSVENLFGGTASDTLTAVGAVSNVLDGGPGFGDDTLNGGEGPDFLSGGFGFDILNGESGNDRLHSRGDQSVDTDNCGLGNGDTAEADSFDTFNDCENVFNTAAFTQATSSEASSQERQWAEAKQLIEAAQRAVDRIKSG